MQDANASKSLTDQIVWVTGAGTGIGRETCVQLARRGAVVALSDVQEDRGQETLELVRAAGSEGLFLRCDVSSADQVRATVAAVVERFGGLDLAFNNAGIAGAMAPTPEYPEDSWHRVLAVNLTGAWNCMRFEIPAMLRRGGGAIVNNASILGQVGFANACAYTATKHGLLGLTKVAALEYATQGIRINAVCPGFIETPMLEGAGIRRGTEQYDAVVGLHPVARLGRPEEVAAAVVWLLGQEASFVAGHAMAVDGGYLAR